MGQEKKKKKQWTVTLGSEEQTDKAMISNSKSIISAACMLAAIPRKWHQTTHLLHNSPGSPEMMPDSEDRAGEQVHSEKALQGGRGKHSRGEGGKHSRGEVGSTPGDSDVPPTASCPYGHCHLLHPSARS